MKERIIITSIMLLVILIISIIDKFVIRGEIKNFLDEVEDFDLGSLAWLVRPIMLLAIIQLVAK